MLHDVFLGLGGNIGDTYTILSRAIARIEMIPTVSHLEVSPFYLTSPVSDIPQGLYINAVCRLRTSLSPIKLLRYLQQIETNLGRVPKRKNAARILDIDILLHGKEASVGPPLDIPHPRWLERLFVLRPMADLVSHIELPDGSIVDVKQSLKDFPYAHQQWVWPLEGEQCLTTCGIVPVAALDLLIGEA